MVNRRAPAYARCRRGNLCRPPIARPVRRRPLFCLRREGGWDSQPSNGLLWRGPLIFGGPQRAGVFFFQAKRAEQTLPLARHAHLHYKVRPTHTHSHTRARTDTRPRIATHTDQTAAANPFVAARVNNTPHAQARPGPALSQAPWRRRSRSRRPPSAASISSTRWQRT